MATALGGFVSVRIDQRSLENMQKTLAGIKDGVPRAMARALNNTAKKARTRCGARNGPIRKDIRLKTSDILGSKKNEIEARVKGPNESNKNKATFNKLEARISTPKRGLKITNFVTTPIPDKLPAKTKVKPTGKAKSWPNGFYLKLKKGAEAGDQYGLFIRKDGKLKHIYGPSLSQVLGRELPKFSPEMQEELEIQMERETAAVLRQYGDK